jgi:hypothetical protein
MNRIGLNNDGNTNMTNDSGSSSNSHRVKLYGQPNSAAAYEIRDFLSRSVVEFDWIELMNDRDCDRELDISTLSDVSLPVVQFPDGTQLFAPTIREIAHRLGWVTQPKFKEYDLVTGSDLFQAGRTPECWTLDRDPFFLETSVPGSFAAGDVRHGSVKRVASAVGEGAMAVTFVHKYLEETR